MDMTELEARAWAQEPEHLDDSEAQAFIDGFLAGWAARGAEDRIAVRGESRAKREYIEVEHALDLICALDVKAPAQG